MSWKKRLELITTQSGTPLGVQCSSSGTYCFFHISTCQYMPGLVNFDLWKMCDKRLIKIHLFRNSYSLFQVSNLQLRPLKFCLTPGLEIKKGRKLHWVKFRPSHDTNKITSLCVYSSSRVYIEKGKRSWKELNCIKYSADLLF